MTNITAKGGMRFIKAEGINQYPSIVVLACKLFVKDEPEGTDAGIYDKLQIGDDVIYDKTIKNFTDVITSKCSDIIRSTIPFKADNTNKFANVKKVLRYNDITYKIYSDKITYGATADSITELTVPTNVSISKIIKIIKRANDYIFITTDGIWIPTNNVWYNVFNATPINDVVYNGNRFFVATNIGIFFTKGVFDLATVSSATYFAWNKAVYKTKTVVSTATPPVTTYVPNGLDPSDRYNFISDYGPDSISAYSASAQYICKIQDIINNYDTNDLICGSSNSMVAYSTTTIGSSNIVCTSAGCLNTTNKSSISGDGIKDVILVKSTYTMLTTSGVALKTASIPSPVSFNSDNGVPAGTYNYILNYDDENGETRIVCIGDNIAYSSLSVKDNFCSIYPIHYIQKTDYKLEQQYVAKFNYSIFEFYMALYDKTTIFWNKLLYVKGLATNFIIIRTRKSNGINNVWYLCGDDNREETEYPLVCKEFIGSF